jgi:transposase
MCEQREVVPSAGIVDSQSVKAPGAHERGYDAHKKISGRKRHIAVDTDGRLLAMNLTPADVADSTGAQLILDALIKRWPWVKHLFGDAAYDRRKLLDKATYLDFTVEVVRGLQGQSGFQVQPRRWVVERTFGWLMRYRRLVRDYEQRLDVSEAMIYRACQNFCVERGHEIMSKGLFHDRSDDHQKAQETESSVPVPSRADRPVAGPG